MGLNSSYSSFSISMKDGSKLAKKIEKLSDGAEVAVSRTVSDFKSRGPGWVRKELKKHYTADNAALKDAGPVITAGEPFSVKGKFIDGATLTYKGRPLTLTHFKFTPKSQPKKYEKKYTRIPGVAIGDGSNDVAMIRQPKQYDVKVTIIKGQTKSLSRSAFVTTVNGGMNMPFVNRSGAHTPIEIVRTLSVPQMITNEAQEDIDKSLEENLQKRFEHHVQQAMK